jgi:phenylalanyl-tRNA synthetase beta chain
VKIALSHLRRYCPALPADPAAVRHLLDDVGIEVKRVSESGADVSFSLELLANRGDHRCYAGIARELCGRVGGELLLPPVAELTTTEGASAGLSVSVESEACLLYTATSLSIEPAGGLPADLIVALAAADLQQVNVPVDASNLANLELGQPTHCFDAEAIRGGITIRASRPGERAWLLFQTAPVPLPPGTLVIADAEKVLAVAGVIGCEESKVSAATTRVVLESAAFDPVTVRVGARNLRVQTDASARFERGCDPSLALAGGAARVTYLLERHAGARRQGPTIVAGAWRDPQRTIDLDIGRLSAFLARPIEAAECTRRLTPYGFAVREEPEPAGGQRLRVTVPAGRTWDVESPQDLYEEVARSIGYNELPEALPANLTGVLPSSEEQTREAADRVLLGHGFYEVLTDGFYSRSMRDELCGADERHPLWPHLEIENAIDSSFALLKNNCLGHALAAVDANQRLGTDTLKLFEWTRTFHPNPAPPNGTCDERRRLWLIAYGKTRDASWAEHPPAIDVWFLKGLVEELGVELRQALAVGAPDPDNPLSQCLHPYRQASIELAGRRIGVFGEVSPRVLRSFGLKRVRPYYLDLDASALRLDQQTSVQSLPSLRPASVRMLAFTLPERVQAGAIARFMQETGPAWLDRVAIVDSFAHEEGGAPVRTITYSVEYDNEQNEHSAEVLNTATEALVRSVEREFGERGVHLRTQ